MGRKSRGAKDEGVPIRGALDRWAPRELWQRYNEVAQHDATIIHLGMYRPRADEAHRLRSQLLDWLTEQLKAGQLIASGMESPLRDICAPPRQDIARDLWPLLSLDMLNNRAIADGLKIVDLKIRPSRAWSGRSVAGGRKNAGGEGVEEGQPNQPRVGPKTLMPMIRQEMERRAERGELLPTLAAESRYLESWVKRAHPDFERPPVAKSIREALRHEYNRLKRVNEAGI